MRGVLVRLSMAVTLVGTMGAASASNGSAAVPWPWVGGTAVGAVLLLWQILRRTDRELTSVQIADLREDLRETRQTLKDLTAQIGGWHRRVRGVERELGDLCSRVARIEGQISNDT